MEKAQEYWPMIEEMMMAQTMPPMQPAPMPMGPAPQYGGKIQTIHTVILSLLCRLKLKYLLIFREKNPTIWHRFNTRIILFIAPLTLNLEINVDGGDRPTNVGMPGSHFSEEEVSEILQDLLH